MLVYVNIGWFATLISLLEPEFHTAIAVNHCASNTLVEGLVLSHGLGSIKVRIHSGIQGVKDLAVVGTGIRCVAGARGGTTDVTGVRVASDARVRVASNARVGVGPDTSAVSTSQGRLSSSTSVAVAVNTGIHCVHHVR